MSRELNTDKTAGDGNKEVSRTSINVIEYAGARAREMEAMAAVSRRTWGNNKAMQILPRHMRRRAASHNIKRLPRRLQDKGRREMASSGNPTKTKCPSRRHRRRPGNLLEEYSRRSRQNVWLETHIWHAKRFHMDTQWGYRIPLHPNGKGVRAAYRGAARFCNMRDISYMCCIELQGPQAKLLKGLYRLCSVETGPTPGAVRYVSGMREGEAVFYRNDQYPSGALGVVKFLWKPLPSTESSASDTSHRQMWIWCHPGCYEDILTELKTVFKLSTEENKDRINKESGELLAVQDSSLREASGREADDKKVKEGDVKKSVDDVRPSGMDRLCLSNGEVTLTSLKDLLCRFNLSGPLSHAILQDLLKVADVKRSPLLIEAANAGDGHSAVTDETQDDTKPNTSCEQKWWQSYFAGPASSMHDHQCEVWHQLRGLQSAAELTDNVVLGLTSRDPRIFLPRKKMRVTDDPSAISETTLDVVKQWPSDVADSPIWEQDVRHQVKASKMSEAALNELRSNHLVPGTQLELGEGESRIPVLLIQQPGPRPRSGRAQENSSLAGIPLQWGAGWDIVLPQAWAMAFWVGLIYRGARACGLKESLSTATEMGQLHFPEGFPDTPTGKAAEAADKESLEGKYKRMPPAKRPNYTKLGIIAPFRYPWTELISNWVPEPLDSPLELGFAAHGEVVVLRNKRLLTQLDQVCSGMYKHMSHKRQRVSTQQKCVHDGGGQHQEAVLRMLLPHKSLLLVVCVRAVHRGVLEPFSTVCIPTQDDLLNYHKDKKYGGPIEPPHRDTKLKQPKAKKAAETKESASKVTGKEPDAKCHQIDKEGTKGLCEDVVNVRDSSSRAVLGFVKQGGYHFCDGRGSGIAFIVVQGLISLLENRTKADSQAIVLVRSPRSNQYRYAYASILS